MLTKERVLGTRWHYEVIKTKDHTEHKANFEVLEVNEDKLGIFIFSSSTTRYDSEPDLSDLEKDLTLEKLDELVRNGFVRELKDKAKTESDEDAHELTMVTFVGALILFCFFGFFTFIAGIHGTHQKPWEVAIGAAFMISALLAVAIRRS